MKRFVGIRHLATSKSTRSFLIRVALLSLNQAGSLILGAVALTILIQSTADGVSIFSRERVWLAVFLLSILAQVAVSSYMARYIWDQSNTIVEKVRMQASDAYLGHMGPQSDTINPDDFVERVVQTPRRLRSYLNMSVQRGLELLWIPLLTLIALMTLVLLNTSTESIVIFTSLTAVITLLRVRDFLRHPELANQDFESDPVSTEVTETPEESAEAEEAESSTPMGRIKELRWTDGEILSTDDDFVTFPWGIASSSKLTVIRGPGDRSKRALIDIIVGSQDLHRGRLFIDTSKGVFRADEWDHSELRKKISWLSQNPHFVEGTIEENLRLIKPRANREKLREILLDVGLDDAALPEGLKTRLDPADMHLSPEQLRRLALARVILKDAPIVIVEDVESHEQSEFQILLQQVLKNMSREGTLVICMSEDEGLRKIADRVITIDSDQITPTFVVEAAQ